MEERIVALAQRGYQGGGHLDLAEGEGMLAENLTPTLFRSTVPGYPAPTCYA